MEHRTKTQTCVEPNRCYYKFGDDFAHYLASTKSVPDALIALADALIAGAADYKRIAAILNGVSDVEGCGQTHSIMLAVPAEKAKKLIKLGLVQKQDCGE